MCSLANIEPGMCETIVHAKELLSIPLTRLDQWDVGKSFFHPKPFYSCLISSSLLLLLLEIGS